MRLLLFLVPLALFAQGPTTPPAITATTVTPTGACSVNQGRLVGPGGLIYTCQNGTWVQAGGGSGGSSAFSSLTSGTNTGAAMVVGTGASMAATGGGTIAATSVPGFAAGAGTLTGPATSGTALIAGGALGTPSSGNASNLTNFPTLNQPTTGNAATATALASAPTNCSAGSYTLGINVSGAAQGCTALPAFPSGTVVGTTDTQTLANKSIAGSEVNSGTLPHAQLPTLLSADIPNNAANTSGTAANLSGAPTLPNGTSATTQSAADNTVAVATDQFVHSLAARGLSFPFGTPGGSALSTGVLGYLTVPFACTITGWSIQADAGTDTVKWLKVAAGTAIPTLGSNSISTSGIALASGTVVQSTTVTDFTTTAVTANDIIAADLITTSGTGYINPQLVCAQ